MKTLNNIFIISLLAMILPAGASPGDWLDFFYGTHRWGNAAFSYFPDLEFGSHRIGAGYNAEIDYWQPVSAFGKSLFSLQLKADANAKYFETNFGIPGRSLVFEPGGTFAIGFGSPSSFGPSKWLRGGPTRFALRYRYSYYFASDSTSQLYGEYRVEVNLSRYKFILGVGNDDLAFSHTDKFRSAAVDLTLYKNGTDYTAGASIGMKLWTGDFTSQLYLNRNQRYTFEGIYGGNYTLGLLYGSFIYNCYRLSIGIDSDGIRTFFQNGMHKIVDNGLTPDVKRIDRMFFQVSLFGNNDQY
jgi:hypothetical protein